MFCGSSPARTFAAISPVCLPKATQSRPSVATQPFLTCSISLPKTGIPAFLAASNKVGRLETTVLSVKLLIQSTFDAKSLAAIGISDGWLIPLSTISKLYFGASSLYSAIALTELVSLVEYKIPIFLASGKNSLIILSCASTASLSLVPVILPTPVPSSFAS